MTLAAPLQLQPLSLGRIFDRAIRLYRRNFAMFVGIVAVVYIPLTIINILLTTIGGEPDFANLGYVLRVSLLGPLFTFILVTGLGSAAMTRAIADTYLGQKLSVIDAYRRIGRSWLSVLGALLVVGLLSIAALIWFLVPCIGWLTGLGILGFLGFVIVPLVPAVVVLERQRAAGAWRRAWDLVRERFWPVVGFFFALFLFNLLAVVGPGSLVTAVLDAGASELVDSGGFATSFAGRQIISTTVTFLLSLVYSPFQLAAVTLLYFDLRVRNEGFDLELLAKSSAEETWDTAGLTSDAPRPGSGSLVTGRELGYFAALSLIPLAFYVVLVAILFAAMLPLAGIS